MGHSNENNGHADTTVSKPIGITMHTESPVAKTTTDKEADIQRLLLQERMRLEKEYGVGSEKIDHFKRPLDTCSLKTKEQTQPFCLADLLGSMRS